MEAHDIDPQAKVVVLEKMPESLAGGNSIASGQTFIVPSENGVSEFRKYLEACNEPNPIPDEYLDWLVFDQIYDEKWLNASVSMKTVNTEMTQKLSDIRSNLAALSLSVSDVKEEAIERYKADLNFTSALAYINQYEAQRARIQEAEEENRKKEQEAQLERERQRIREEERQRIREEEKIRQQAKAEVAQEIKAPITDEVVSNAKVSAVYAVSAPQESLAELEMAMDSLGVTWERKEL